MKIAIVSTPIFAVPLAGYGGLEDVAYQSAKGLAAKGHDVTLIAPDGSSCPGVTIIPVGKPGTVHESRAFEIYGNELPKFQVVIDHSWQKHSFLMKMQGALSAPILAVVHAPVNTMYQSLPNVEKPSFVCISQDQANHFDALHSRQAKVCYNGIDLNVYKPIEGMKRTNRFLFLARFSSIKGPDIGIQACRATNSNLDLIGDTSITQEPEYYHQCASMCDGKQIRMIGPCKRGEAVWWYSQSFAMLHPNMRFREPLGLAPVEAMACGSPVLAWRFGAMKETVRHGETGFLCDSIIQMQGYIEELKAKSEHAMSVMRDNCRDWAKEFSVDKMVNRYEELCAEAIETGGW